MAKISGIELRCGVATYIVPYEENEEYFSVDEDNNIIAFWINDYIRDNGCPVCKGTC